MSESRDCVCPEAAPEADALLAVGPAAAPASTGFALPLDDLPPSLATVAVDQPAGAPVPTSVAETTAVAAPSQVSASPEPPAAPAVPTSPAVTPSPVAATRVDPVAMTRELVAGSLLGVAYVMFLPLVGLAVPLWIAGERLARAVRRRPREGGAS